ncbi:MAG: restriction endonuclease [Ardenticatenaceae bacterium]|nr:restriction endonuclease [Ardenticatenaceae bacterium]
MARRRCRSAWRMPGIKHAVEVGLGLALFVAAFGWFVAGWSDTSTLNATAAAFLVGTALWLLRPPLRLLRRLLLDLSRKSAARSARRFRRHRAFKRSPLAPSGTPGLSPREFEALCADVCRAWGYEAQLGPGTGDGGVDIELWRDGDFGIAQCKLYRGSVPIAMVRDFYGTMVHRQAAFGFLFTTGRFPASAEEFVAGKGIRLVDGAYLRAILLEQRQRGWLSRLRSRVLRS